MSSKKISETISNSDTKSSQGLELRMRLYLETHARKKQTFILLLLTPSENSINRKRKQNINLILQQINDMLMYIQCKYLP